MSSCVTVRTRHCPCGKIFSGTIDKVNMQTKLHILKCETCSSVDPKKNTNNVFVGYRYDKSKYGNFTMNRGLDAIVNNGVCPEKKLI